MNLLSVNSRLFTQAELRLATVTRDCTAMKYALTEHEFSIFGSKHPTVFLRDQKGIIFFHTEIESKSLSIQISTTSNDISKTTFISDRRQKSWFTGYT